MDHRHQSSHGAASRPQPAVKAHDAAAGPARVPGEQRAAPAPGQPAPAATTLQRAGSRACVRRLMFQVLLNHAHLVIGREHTHVQRHSPHHRGASTSEQPCCAVLLHDPAGSSMQVSEYSCFQLVLTCNTVLWDLPPCSRDSIHRSASGMRLCWGKAASAFTAAGHAAASANSRPVGQPPRAPDERVDHALVVAPPLDGQRGVRLRSSSRQPAEPQPPQGSRHMSQTVVTVLPHIGCLTPELPGSFSMKAPEAVLDCGAVLPSCRECTPQARPDSRSCKASGHRASEQHRRGHAHLHADEGQVGGGADEGAHAARRQPRARLLVQRDGLQRSGNRNASCSGGHTPEIGSRACTPSE